MDQQRKNWRKIKRGLEKNERDTKEEKRREVEKILTKKEKERK